MRKLMEKHFIECKKEGVDPFKALEPLDQWEYERRFKIVDIEKPLYEVLRKISTLMLYFFSDKLPDEPENIVNTHFAVFGPRMVPFYYYQYGTRPELDRIIGQIQDERLAIIAKEDRVLHK